MYERASSQVAEQQNKRDARRVNPDADAVHETSERGSTREHAKSAWTPRRGEQRGRRQAHARAIDVQVVALALELALTLVLAALGPNEPFAMLVLVRGLLIPL
jgi:hypothetical protein